MRTSCVKHPENNALILIRSWQYDLLGDTTKCALLSIFEYWHSRKLEQRDCNIKKNAIAERHGEVGTQDESLLQHHTAEQLEAQLLGIAKRTSIRKALKELSEDGFITVRKNPNPRYKFDSTNYYLFWPAAVDSMLSYWEQPKTTPRHTKSDGSGAVFGHREVKNGRGEVKNEGTRSETTLEITNREEDLVSLTEKASPKPETSVARMRKPSGDRKELQASELALASLEEPMKERFEKFWRNYKVFCKKHDAKFGSKKQAAEAWVMLIKTNFQGLGLDGFEKGGRAWALAMDKNPTGIPHGCRYLFSKQKGEGSWQEGLELISTDKDLGEFSPGPVPKISAHRMWERKPDVPEDQLISIKDMQARIEARKHRA